MFKSFFIDNGTFVSYGPEHYWSVSICVIFGTLVIYLSGKYLSLRQQQVSITTFCLVILFSHLAKVVIKLQLGVFDYQEDLPLHLCNMLPFVIPFALYFRNRALWAVLFLWIIAGTFQSLITPTLKDSFPHYEYFRYWIVHCGLVIAALYPIFVWDFKLKFKDVIVGAIAMNALALVMYFINLLLGSNYMYLVAKPPEDTINNLLGPWPWYILSLEGVMAILFFILYLPFLIQSRMEKEKWKTLDYL